MAHSGDISAIAMTQFKADLAAGDFHGGISFCFELARLLAYHNQLHDLWHFQIAVRKVLIQFFDNTVSTAIELSSTDNPGQALAKIHTCHEMLDLCTFTKVFDNVAYYQNLDSIPSSIRMQGLAAAIWKRYMRRRITAFNKKKEIDMVEAFDRQYASFLQARLRRYNVSKLHYLPLAARRALVQREYLELPEILANAAAFLQGYARAKLLSIRLENLRNACIDLSVPTVDRLRRLKPEERLKLHEHLNPSEGGQQDEEGVEIGRTSSLFQDFLDAKLREEEAVKAEAEAKAETGKAPAAAVRGGDIVHDGNEQVVGVDIVPVLGMRVMLRKAALEEFTELIEDSGGGAGTITWVDPEDMDGDGVTGDICEVQWDKTGTKADYRTGYEGQFRLATVQDWRGRGIKTGDSAGEQVVGRDVAPEEGMRVVIREAALQQFPELLEDSQGGPGTITWVDPEDLDGDGVTGDICEVRWDKTKATADYRTGYEGEFRLALFRGFRFRAVGMDKEEMVVGIDVTPVRGMRVVLMQSALSRFPELMKDSGGGAGSIVWVDPEDLDGDGVPGDICQVTWEKTGVTGDYRTGFNGHFCLALWYDEASEAAGLTLQRVVRGHRERVALRTVLMGEYLRAKEEEHAYRQLGAVLRVQSAIRCHHSRTKRRFREVLRAYRAREQEVGADQHTPIPLRLQSVYRAHLARQDLRALLFARLLAVSAEDAARAAHLRKEKLHQHRHLCLKTRYKLHFWWWFTKILRRWRSVHDRIRYAHELGWLWTSLGQWKQHSIDAKRRCRVARVLLNLTDRYLLFRPRVGGALERWSWWAKGEGWREERAILIRAARRQRMLRGVYREAIEMVARAKRRLGSAFKLRARVLFRVCTHVAREWHVTAWRRRVVRHTADVMLPTWVEFLYYRAFRVLKLNTDPGWMAGTEGDIARLKLQAAYVPVSKVTSTALKRWESEQPQRVQSPLALARSQAEEQQAVQEIVMKRAAFRVKRQERALETNQALFSQLQSSKSESHLLAAAQAPSQASARGGDNVPAPTHSVSSRSLASTSASVRVKLPRSRRRGKGTAAEAAASSRRAQSALEGDRSFWTQRTRVLMERPASELGGGMAVLGATMPNLGGGGRAGDMLRRQGAGGEWEVVNGATTSLLKLLLPAVHKSPPAGQKRGDHKRAWESPSSLLVQ